MSTNRHISFDRNHGFLEMQILWVLHKHPSYGYELMKTLSELKGKKITQGTVYPTLAKLEKSGLLKSKKDGKRIVYSITKKGDRTAKIMCEDFSKMFMGIFREFVCSKCKVNRNAKN